MFIYYYCIFLFVSPVGNDLLLKFWFRLQDDHQEPPSLLDEDDSSLFDIYNLEQHYSLLAPQSLVIVRPYSASSGSSCGDGEDDSRVLNELRPRWIIMYAPDMGFVRRIEVKQNSSFSFPMSSPKISIQIHFFLILITSNSGSDRFLKQKINNKALTTAIFLWFK